MRYEYYEEKRQLKIRALENVLLKVHQARNGHVSPEIQQIVSLLEDMHSSQLTAKTSVFDQSKLSNYNQKRKWRFNDATSPVKSQSVAPNYAGVNYKQVMPSPLTLKSKRIIDKMPKNLYDFDNQSKFRNFIDSTFPKHVESLNPSPQRQRNNTQGDTRNIPRQIENTLSSCYDTFSYGFELPASMQINRINKKIDKMRIAQERESELRHSRETMLKMKMKKKDKKIHTQEKFLAE